MANHQININSIAGRIGTSDIPTTANGFYDDQRRHDLYEFQLRQLEQNKKKKIKTRDSNCCSINFVTYVLHIFNILFFFSGIANLGVAIWTIFWKHQYVTLFDTSTYWMITYGLLLAGALTILTSFIGYCGIWREQKTLLCCYSFFLTTIFIMEFSIGGTAYIYETQVDDELLRTMNGTFINSYGIDTERTEAIDLMQQNFKCCGAIRFEDWSLSKWQNLTKANSYIRPNENRVVPDSCCITYRVQCGKSNHPSNIPYTGCIYTFIDITRDHLNILAAVASGLCFIPIFGLILSCCLCLKLRDFEG